MSPVEDRSRLPRLPFVDDEGCRVRSTLTAAGPVDFRPGQALVKRDAVGGDGDLSSFVDAIRRATGVTIRIDEFSNDRPDKSGYVLVHFDENDLDVPGFLGGMRKSFGDESTVPNTVFTIGSLTADPMRFAGGFGADPMRFAAAYGADPMRFANSSTARPAVPSASHTASAGQGKGPGKPTVAVLDTGVAAVGAPLVGDIDFACATGTVRERPDMNADAYLDIAAGHTTFIRTIIQRAPAAEVIVEGVIHNDGDGDEADIAAALGRVYDAVQDKSRLIVNLSFSGYYENDAEPPMIGFWIRQLIEGGAVVVAAAGNNGECRPKFPAAMPDVVAVSSLGPCGPSWFSNHGRWVDAAPGEDLISEFFANFDGAFESVVAGALPDIDDFHGWAMWSGTSFSTPAIVGALAELVETHDCTAVDAVAKLIGRPGLFRLPDYGVVVNRIF